MIPAIGQIKPILNVSSVDLLTGLQAYYKLEESSGTIYDATDNNRDLSVSGSPDYSATGKNNNCIALENDNQGAYFYGTGMGTSLGSFSISLWVYVDGSSKIGLFRFGKYNDTWVAGIQIDRSTIEGYVKGKDGWFTKRDLCSKSSISNGWHHITLVKDTSNEEQILYIDGTAEHTLTSLNFTSSITLDNDRFEIFRYHINSFYGIGIYDVKIDEIGIYNIALNSDQITALADETFYDNF